MKCRKAWWTSLQFLRGPFAVASAIAALYIWIRTRRGPRASFFGVEVASLGTGNQNPALLWFNRDQELALFDVYVDDISLLETDGDPSPDTVVERLSSATYIHRVKPRTELPADIAWIKPETFSHSG